MKYSVLTTVMAFSAILGTGSKPLFAGINEWTSLGPDGGGARAVAVDPQNPNTVYAVTFAGIFKTTDGGARWRATSPIPSTFGGVRVLAIDPRFPSTLYAAIEGGGMFKSTDGGSAWNEINSGLGGTYTLQARVSSLAI